MFALYIKSYSGFVFINSGFLQFLFWVKLQGTLWGSLSVVVYFVNKFMLQVKFYNRMIAEKLGLSMSTFSFLYL